MRHGRPSFGPSIDLRPIGLVSGTLLIVLAIFMVPSMIADLAAGHADWQVFFVTACATCFIGTALVLTNRGTFSGGITTRQGFLLTTIAWLVTSVFAAIPFMLCELEMTVADSIFEAVSGITTTGATVIIGLDFAPPGLLLWRAILQWLGGIGIIVMGIAILPMLNIGGMQLFRTENSDRSDKILPRTAQIASNIGLVYVGLSGLCALFYFLSGMNWFDAVAHSMTTISTGGLSTRDSSIGGFGSMGIEWTAILFMMLSGRPFVLYIQAVRGNRQPLLQDVQARWYLCIVAIGTIALTSEHIIVSGTYPSVEETVRHSVFATITVMTGTGYSSDDYNQWGTLAVATIFFFSCLGGCTGSTTGGIKIFRIVILYQVARVQVMRLFQPSGVFRVLYNHRPIGEEMTTSVLAFIFLFGLTFALVALALSVTGLSFVTAMSGSIAALANVGPGLGPVIGPAGNYQPVPDAAKWVLSFAMLFGRLELFTILVLFVPAFWRN